MAAPSPRNPSPNPQSSLLLPKPLGQSWLQPRFLMPLGSRPLSILQPAIFLKPNASLTTATDFTSVPSEGENLTPLGDFVPISVQDAPDAALGEKPWAPTRQEVGTSPQQMGGIPPSPSANEKSLPPIPTPELSAKGFAVPNQPNPVLPDSLVQTKPLAEPTPTSTVPPAQPNRPTATTPSETPSTAIPTSPNSTPQIQAATNRVKNTASDPQAIAAPEQTLTSENAIAPPPSPDPPRPANQPKTPIPASPPPAPSVQAAPLAGPPSPAIQLSPTHQSPAPETTHFSQLSPPHLPIWSKSHA
jgi:hypothetical protein